MNIHKYSGSEDFYILGYIAVGLRIWKETAVFYVQYSPEITEGRSGERSIGIAEVPS
jgi:hypothetical protein